MAWINYKKAYDMITHSWILESLELANLADNVIEFTTRSMRNWNVNLTSCGEFVGNVNIRRGIFQGDSLLPLFCDLYDPPHRYIKECSSGLHSEVPAKIK